MPRHLVGNHEAQGEVGEHAHPRAVRIVGQWAKRQFTGSDGTAGVDCGDLDQRAALTQCILDAVADSERAAAGDRRHRAH